MFSHLKRQVWLVSSPIWIACRNTSPTNITWFSRPFQGRSLGCSASILCLKCRILRSRLPITFGLGVDHKPSCAGWGIRLDVLEQGSNGGREKRKREYEETC